MQSTSDKISIIILVEKFISDSEKGKRLQKNGSVISKSTIKNYHALLTNINIFCKKTENEWPFNVKYKASKTNFKKEKRYYNRFYSQFTGFLYMKGCTDNYVGMQIKILRTFFIYQIMTIGIKFHPTGLYQ